MGQTWRWAGCMVPRSASSTAGWQKTINWGEAQRRELLPRVGWVGNPGEPRSFVLRSQVCWLLCDACHSAIASAG